MSNSQLEIYLELDSVSENNLPTKSINIRHHRLMSAKSKVCYSSKSQGAF